MAMPENILIVDDQAEMLRLLGMTLEKRGFAISVAQSAAAALARIRAAKPDLIILDVMLPDVSGIELCEQLRRQPETAEIPILMLSALGQVPDKVAGLKSGADDYLVKPIDAAELVARVDGLLERVRRLKAPPAGPVAKIVSFVGAKGGVGTSTTAANVGAAAAQLGTSAVVVELQAQQGSLQLILGLSSNDGSTGLLSLDPTAIRKSNAAGWVTRHASGVQVLAAPSGVHPDRHLDPAHAEAIVGALAGMAQVVLIDLPPGWSEASEAALRMSQVVILVLEPTRVGLETAAAASSYLRSIARPGADLRLIVVARSPTASPISARQIQERLGWGLLGSIPPAADESAHAQQLGTLVIQSQPDSTVSQAYRDIARQIL